MRSIILSMLLLCIAGAACLMLAMDKRSRNNNVPVAAIDTTLAEQHNRYNAQRIDSAITMLHSGYVVLRMGYGADSRMLAQMCRKNTSFSHCGIVMIEHGYPFVYHSIGGEDNPDMRLRRDSARFFFSPLNNAAIGIVRYDYDSNAVNRLNATVQVWYKRRPRFDMKFDLATDDYLYCSEFVYKSLNSAAGDTSYIKPSSLLGRRFVGVDDLFVNPHAHLVWQTKFK